MTIRKLNESQDIWIMNNVNSVESWKNVSDRKRAEQRTREEIEIKKR